MRRVSNGDELEDALATAKPGDRIVLADGLYLGSFRIDRPGAADKRIRLCGSRQAVLQHGVISTSRGLYLDGASYWDLQGFTVAMAKKGIVLARSSFNALIDLEVHTTGEEGVHLRSHSTDNRIESSYIHHTGLLNVAVGEGVYIGSAVGQWCLWSACGPDRSDRNAVVGSRFDNNEAEAIDVKEGTTAGLIAGNSFDGSGTSGRAWVNVKGNDWVIRDNAGVTSPQDGFLTELAHASWGQRNVFVSNVADLRGPGYGFNVRGGSIVGCDNVVKNAGLGMANVECSAVPDA